ncbi:MAG: hypothetical protein VKJ02_06935 [Snowella sp.]|nr:hypothetical protein [Snowella sp.]
MADIEFRGLETCSILIKAYATLSIDHEKTMTLEENNAELFKRPINPYVNYKNTFALLILNASIIEGGLRTILSEQIHLEREKETQYRINRGLTEQSKAELFFLRFLYDVETQGGWDKLKEQYIFFNNVSLDSLMKKKDPDLREAITILFRLRNVLSHGTAIIQPNQPMDESMQDLYPYKWQSQLQQGAVYLKKFFENDNIFENLAEHGMPEHFWKRTQELFDLIENKFTSLPSRSQRIVKMIKEYSFGYRLPFGY